MKEKLIYIIAFIFTLLSISCKDMNNKQSMFSHKITDLDHIKIGVMEGSVHDLFVNNNYPDAIVMRFQSPTDLVAALTANKVDVVMMPRAYADFTIENNPGIDILIENIFSNDLGFGFNKDNSELKNQFDSFLNTIRKNGDYDKIYDRWFGDDKNKNQMPKYNFSDKSKVLKVGVGIGNLPFVCMQDGEYTGFDIELIYLFSQMYNFRPVISSMQFNGLINSLISERSDIIAYSIAITEERQKQILFSEAYYIVENSVLCLKERVPGQTSNNKDKKEYTFINIIKKSFHSNLILENRYKLIINGLKVTFLISIFSVIFGTILGALICFLKMSNKRFMALIANTYIIVLRGTPVLVLLMIIYYIIFSSINIDPLIVAVFAFGLNFAAYVSEMFRAGIESIDKGQYEAGIALGFSKVKTFVYIILPQAIKSILPVYKGEIISLVKMTSIVGYIAVEDLTKAGDIIRSRTFDAFFPLLLVAFLYFTLSNLILLSLTSLEKISNPKLRRIKKRQR